MSNIKVDDRVITIENGEIKKATVKLVYDNVAVVDFGEGYRDKRRLYDLALDPVREIPEEKPIESIRQSKITITFDEFNDKVQDSINELTDNFKLDGATSMLFNAFSGHLASRLFFRGI